MDGVPHWPSAGSLGSLTTQKHRSTEAQRHRDTEKADKTKRKKPQCLPCHGVLKYCNSAALAINIREVSTNQSQTLFFRDAFSLNIDTATDLA